MIVVRAISYPFDVPLHRRLGVVAVEVAVLAQQDSAQLEIRDLVSRGDIIHLADDAAGEDDVDGVGRVATVEIASRGRAVSMDDERLIPVEEADELGDHLCACCTEAGASHRGGEGTFSGYCCLLSLSGVDGAQRHRTHGPYTLFDRTRMTGSLKLL